MKRYLPTTLLILLCTAGCVSSSQPVSRPLFSPKPVVMLTSTQQTGKSLSRDLRFIRNGGGSALGGARLTLLAGTYVCIATDSEGTYWKHKDRGILRSGNIGMAESGGVYVPNDRSKMCEVWMTPKGSAAAEAVVGPVLAAGIPKQDPKTTVTFVGEVPALESADIRAAFEP